jgi:DNA-binding LacI/PurR family transcriptional regulator
VALLCSPYIIEQLAPVLAEIERRAMTMRPYWVQGVHLAAPQLARNCMHLLLHENQRERPNALIISDDNLVEFATAGLIVAGVRVPDDLEVVAHCNFPWPTPSVVPVKRLGYEVSRVLQACLDSIDLQRRGETAPEATVIPAVFEEEVAVQNPLAEHQSFPHHL